MKPLSLKNRIALNYIIVTSVLIAVLFSLIYIVVYDTVYSHLDSDLDAETNEVYSSLVILNDTLIFSNPYEWGEKEHGQIEVNPTFVQVIDTLGNIIKKTPNLRETKLSFNKSILKKSYFNTTFADSPVRQLQTSIKNGTNKTLGYLIIAVPLEESAIVLRNLSYTLIVGYPLVLIFLFTLSRFIAGRVVAPINKVISTSARISQENLDERIELPEHKDEIYTLTLTINNLLDRLEDVVFREKQFTADASHELRTPLSIIKGNLEVLIRRPRETQQYLDKINYVIKEIDRMSNLVDQLLNLARLESNNIKPAFTQVDLKLLVEDLISRFTNLLEEKKLAVNLKCDISSTVRADWNMIDVMIENIFSNAIKYSFNNQKIDVEIKSKDNAIECLVKDFGIGIPSDQIKKIFDRFYRVDESRNSQIIGQGLGLSIVKRLADLQNIEISLQSEKDKGTTVSLLFRQ